MFEKEAEEYADTVKCEWKRICEAKSDTNAQLIKQLADKIEEIKRLKDKNKALELYADLADGKVDEVTRKLTEAREIIENILPFEHVIDPYAFTSDIEENKRRFHEPFRKAEAFLKEVEE